MLTEQHDIKDDRKEIAENYMKGWFTLDILSCIPYGALGEALLSKAQMEKLVLIKLVKLLRIVKLSKDQTKMFYYMHKYMKISNPGMQRLAFFALIFLVGAHITSCFWLILARIVNPTYHGTWAVHYAGEFKAGDNMHAYYIAAYWALQTITTVGYGDVDIENNYERIVGALVMTAGVILFTVANATIISIAADLDESGEY